MPSYRDVEPQYGTFLRDMREARKGKGSQIDYQKDLGVSASPAMAQRVREDEAIFDERMGTWGSEISESQGKVSSAQAEIAAANKRFEEAKKDAPYTTIDKEWNKYTQSFIPMIVHSGGQVEETYYMPPEAAHNIAQGLNQTSFYQATYHKDNNAFDVNVYDRGKEIHETMADAGRSIKANFFEQSAPAVIEANKSIDEQLREAAGQISGYQAQVAQSQGEIDAARRSMNETQALRDEQWEQIRGDYQNKLANMKSMWEKATLKGAEKNG